MKNLIILSIIFAFNSFKPLETDKFVSLKVNAKNGCSTGFNQLLENFNRVDGIFELTFQDCGTEKMEVNTSMSEVSMPTEVYTILDKIYNNLSNISANDSAWHSLKGTEGKFYYKAELKNKTNFNYTISLEDINTKRE